MYKTHFFDMTGFVRVITPLLLYISAARAGSGLPMMEQMWAKCDVSHTYQSLRISPIKSTSVALVAQAANDFMAHICATSFVITLQSSKITPFKNLLLKLMICNVRCKMM